MILSSLSDNFHVNITFRIRTVFFFYAVISAACTVFVWFSSSPATDWDWFYQIIFPFSFLSCMYMAFKPRIGEGSLYLMPIFIGALVRVVDIWESYFRDGVTLPIATLGSIGWSFLLISITYIDLLESRIYHRLVNFIDDTEANR